MVKVKNSLSIKLLSMLLAMSILLGALPPTILSVFALANTNVAQIGDTYYETLAEAINAVNAGENCVTPSESTEIKLLTDTAYGFDVGKSTGSVTKNISIDLGGHTLTLMPAVGSTGTTSNGIRVLAYSKLAISNGKIVCPDDDASNIKTGIANYGELILNNVELKSGALTIYTINNRGKLILSGNTSVENGKVEQTSGKGDYIAITNDPYNLYYTTNVDAALICDSADVSVGTVQIERYERKSSNKGVVKLDISNGTFDRIVEDGNSSVNVSYDLTGGTIGVYNDTELKNALNMITPGAEYTCPEKAVTIKLMGDGTFAHGFDVGTSNGKAPKNIVLDLNGKSLTLNPAVGSVGTVSNGIRVLAYSKLCIKNGTLVCPDETEANIKTGIANYSDLTLDDVIVKSGALTQYTINNRGKLTLLGETQVENGKVAPNDYTDMKDKFVAITNDPYTTYNTSNDNNASLICNSKDVVVGNVQLECYGNQDKKIILDISDGSFGEVLEPVSTGKVKVDSSKLIGGRFANDVSKYISTEDYGIIYDDVSKTYKVNALQEVTDFAFETSSPLNQWVGQTYTNIAKSQVSNGAVTYEITAGTDVAEVDNNGNLTFKKVGTVTVVAKLAQTNTHKSAIADYTVTAVKKDQSILAFQASAPVITYNPNELTFENQAIGGNGTGKITYEIIGGSECASIDKDTGVVTIIKAGQVTVKATKDADGQYNEKTAEYVLTIKPSSQSNLVVNAAESITYIKDTPQSVLSVSGGNGDGEVTYSIISGSEFATIDPDTGKITTIKASDTAAGVCGVITVQVEKAGDDCYNAATPVTIDITINFADQTGFAFENTDSDELVVTYNDSNNKFINKAFGGQSTGTISYEITVGTNVADINAQTGELTIKQAGQVTVKAVKGGDTCYNATQASYTLTVNPDTPEFAVSDVDLIYGSGSHKIVVNETNVSSETNRYTYSIESNNFGAEVNDEGIITFKDSVEKVGYVKLTVTHNADARYHELSKEFILTVSYLETDAIPTFDGEKKNNSGWYTGDITISAPIGYEISYSNMLSAVWDTTVSFSTEDNIGKKDVYLKNDDGITNAIPLSGLLLDKTNPSNLKAEYTVKAWDRFLEVVTFGFFNPTEAVVTLTATDAGSGIEYFTFNYSDEQEDGKALASEMTIDEDGTATYSFTVSIDYRDKIEFSAVDVSGRTTSFIDDKVLVVDLTKPELTVSYDHSGVAREENGIIYTNAATTVIFEINESNFDLSLVESDDMPKVILDGNEIPVTWTQDSVTQVWRAECNITTIGEHTVKFSYSDLSKNESVTYEKEIRIEQTAPSISVAYTGTVVKDNIFNTNRTGTITIYEHNFYSDDVVLNVTAKDITGEDIAVPSSEYAEYVRDSKNWKNEGDVHTLVLPEFNIEGIYSIKLNYTDLANNAANTYEYEFVLDKTPAKVVDIKYSIPVWKKVLSSITFGAYEAEVTVTIKTEDLVSGVNYVDLAYTKAQNASSVNAESYKAEKLDAIQQDDLKTYVTEYTLPANARGSISVDVFDNADNKNNADDKDKNVVVVDDKDPKSTVSYTPYKVLDEDTLLEVRDYNEGDKYILYYNGDAVVNFAIDEANFDLSLTDESLKPVITVNGTPVEVTWTQNGDIWTAQHTISGDGVYTVNMSYADVSGNEMSEYTSCPIIIDTTAPDIKPIEYAEDEVTQVDDKGVKFFKTSQTAELTIVDDNFRADDVILYVTTADVTGKQIDVSTDYLNFAKDRANWVTKGNSHTIKLSFDTDARYTIDVEYKDIVDNESNDYTPDVIVIDHAAPTNLNIAYSGSIVDKIIETVTFGFYQPKVTVTLTADDITSGVGSFDWKYEKEKEKDASDINAEGLDGSIEAKYIEYSAKGFTATATFEIPANARGYISATVTDKAGNKASETDKDKVTVVVDKVNPTVSVSYEADSANTKVQFVDTDNDNATVASFDKATAAYFNGDVTAKIVINEANFFEGVQTSEGIIHKVGIKLTKIDDDDNKTVYEYLPNGATQKYNDATPKYITWSTDKDIHTFNINYTDNADYFLEIEYTDLSTNDADISANDGLKTSKTYKSKQVTVDKIAPEVTVEYSNTDVIHNIDERDYFNAKQTATITVKEHNFRADDFTATVEALDIVNGAVDVEDFKATLSNDWKNDSHNVYTKVIEYTVDANYTFDYVYKDLAQNNAKAYDQDKFTVDTTVPENLTVSYSQSIADKILETITFGYYNAKVTVTITADDDTAGIHRFEYAYLKSNGVSSVNAELLNAAIKEADFTVEGNKSTATFTIPKDVLQSNNQFNGTVKFVAFDRSENNTEKADTRRVIVDNITPTASITYNAPVQKVNDISYYDGNIDAKIVITEANFYSEDVIVKVNGEKVNVKWVDDSVDVHTGTFTLTEDGDYIVTVEYSDRSSNKMTDYTSNRLTLDTKAPSVSVSNIKNNSANKNETYGFTITATDINMDADSIKPVLTATVRGEDGKYSTKTISLGDMATVEEGKTYSFTVKNLTDDAVYKLVCTLKDMSGNAYSKITLGDGKEYEEVKFSINRKGSTFAANAATDALVSQYYVYSVYEDVVIEEINTDPIENYTVKLNGKALTEGKDYTSSITNNAGEWSKRTYTVKKDLFKAEGEYSIIVESTDKAQTTAYSDVKNLKLSFVVDQTKPVLTISGLEEGGRYQVEEQTVTIIPTDDGGRLASLKVIVSDSDGAPLRKDGKDISVRFDMSGEELLEYLNNNDGKITFTIPEVFENQVQIICNDCAVNKDGKTNEFNETFKKVTVSQSGWIIFYANKPVFYGSIAGALILVAGIIFLVVFKKRKKEEKK